MVGRGWGSTLTAFRLGAKGRGDPDRTKQIFVGGGYPRILELMRGQAHHEKFLDMGTLQYYSPILNKSWNSI